MSDFSKTVRAEKPCVECRKPFRPSGNCQKRCPECGTAKKRNKPDTRHALDAAPIAKAAFGLIAGKRPAMVTPYKQMPPFAGFLRGLHEAGCTGVVFGDIKITISQV